ncbi:MAG: septation protein SepH [Marmoricola sp.]
MQHLTPVGLSQDGRELLLVSDTGEEFAVRVDHRFRTALRGDPARPGQLEMKMESALRPRDIQARIRAGESADDVAAAAGTTVEAIMPFAAPVLAERAHVAQTAVKCSIRRATTESTPVGRTLDEASRAHFSTVQVRADDVEWDAWRREDGRWNLVAAYESGGTVHLAEFTYDQPGRYVVADNEAALVLTGESTPESPVAAPVRRLNAVPSDSDELPLGDDALELVRDQPAPEITEPVAPVVTELPRRGEVEPTAEVETQEPPAVAEPDAPTEQASFDDLVVDHADADWIATVPVDEEHVEHTAPVEQPEPVEEDVAEAPVPEEDDVVEQPAKKKGRSSVPSWDEIMFGGGKHE